MNNPVFIVGHPKSGTSLMTALLDSHPQLVVLPEESDFYSVVWPYVKILNLAWNTSKDEKNRLVLNRILEDTHLKNLFRGKVNKDISGNLDYQDFDTTRFKSFLAARLTETNKYSRAQCLLAIVSAFAEAECTLKDGNKRLWLEKTPKHLWYIPDIQKDFPNAKFIFTYRDPRDNYISYKKKHGDRLDPLVFARSWNNSFEQIAYGNHANILRIKYEDLVLNPKRELNRVTSFLSIDWDPTLLNPTKNGKPWMGNSMFGEHMTLISSDSLGRFKDVIIEEDLITLEAFCYELMKDYSYEMHVEKSLRIERRRALKNAYMGTMIRRNQLSLQKTLGLIRLLILGKF